jgi:hypothetical protein
MSVEKLPPPVSRRLSTACNNFSTTSNFFCLFSKQERPENRDEESEFLEEGPVVDVLAGGPVREGIMNNDEHHPNRDGYESLADIAADSTVTIIPFTL